MKKITRLLVLFGLIAFSACEKDNGSNINSNDNNSEQPPDQEDEYDFSYYVGFDYQHLFTAAYTDGMGTYTRTIYLGFGVMDNADLYSRGITQLSIGIQRLDGKIIKKASSHEDVKFKKEGDTYWFTALIKDDDVTSWYSLIQFDYLSSPTVELKWTERIKLDDGSYFSLDQWCTEILPGDSVHWRVPSFPLEDGEQEIEPYHNY